MIKLFSSMLQLLLQPILRLNGIKNAQINFRVFLLVEIKSKTIPISKNPHKLSVLDS